MSYAVGYDSNHHRDIGYGVPAICDHPGCENAIDRGLSYVCGGDIEGGEHGCGLFFCSEHLFYEDDDLPQRCERCCDGEDHFEPKPDTEEWIRWKMTDESWASWRAENQDAVQEWRKANRLSVKIEDWPAFIARQAAKYRKKESS